MIKRRKAREVKVGDIHIGGEYPIVIQSMTKTKTADSVAAIRQAKRLEKAGCQIIRLAVMDEADAKALKKIKGSISVPLVADIHFNWRLALAAIESGVDKIRLNPGNIFRKKQVKEVVRAAKSAHIPIRVGVNSGSLRSAGPNSDTSEAMVQSALGYIRMIEGFGFYDIVVSLKASNIFDTIKAYRRIAALCDYPLHLGVTATGPAYPGLIKSSIAISSLLLDGIGDTIRVSLTASPLEEVRAARYILEALVFKNYGFEIISCPTCGRCEVNLAKLVNEFESKLKTVNCKLSAVNSQPVKVAIMGCMVNGPGEAKECDIGVAFAKKEGLLFKAGKPIKKASFSKCAEVLLGEICKICNIG